jgi:hypothetical protein
MHTAYSAEFSYIVNKVNRSPQNYDHLFFGTCEIFLAREILTNTNLAPKIFGTDTICVFEFDKLEDMISLFTKTNKHDVKVTLEDFIDFSRYGTYEFRGTVGVRFKHKFRGLSVCTLAVDTAYENLLRVNACAECSKLFRHLNTCSGCGIAKYCSVDHQKSHWKVHKHHCKRLIREID